MLKLLHIHVYFLSIISFLFVFLTHSYAQDFDCMDCHEEVIKGVHLDVIECIDCHSDVVDEDHVDFGVAKVSCLDCHDDYEASVKNDIHHRLKIGSREKPTCKSCHGNHTIISPSKYKNPSKQFCGSCHTDGNIVLVGSYHFDAVNETTCFDCHEEEDYKPELSTSIHNALSCIDCHSYVTNNLEEHEDGVSVSNRASCFSCHNDVAKLHSTSIHGLKVAEGEEDAAMCWSCHGSHNILPSSDSTSMTHPKIIGNTCGSCHDNPEFKERFNMAVFPGKTYSESVHGKLVMLGDKEAASCISCHGSHTIKNRVQEGSQIAAVNIPNTCGGCHSEITEEYKNSIHWMRAQKGITEAPVCNDCHSEHSVEDVKSENRNEFRLRMQDKTCISCHSDKRMNQKFGNSGKEVYQYLNSYHGLASYRGGINAALCVDCHGVHNILPKRFDESMISVSNVTETCRQCHTQASDRFAISYSHETESVEAKFVENLVQNIYFWLIVVVIGGMVIHNLIIFWYEIRRKRSKEKNVITIPRFTKNEVVQHFILFTSFITLAITGFALEYPSSFWSEGLFLLGMDEIVRSTTHRVAAVIMMALSLYHLIYLLFTARGRNVLYEMLPTFKDIRDLVDNILYHLKIKKKHPHFNQYNYAEKAEYWALIWGTFVMAVTGLILWFPTIGGDWVPIWFIKVAEIIHFYEAILATLAIIVWHWFFVILHPRTYPMSFAWIDGKISLANYREHHENHFRKLLMEWNRLKAGELEQKRVSNFLKLFIKTVEDKGNKIDEVFQNELNTDPELYVWFDNEINKKNE